MSSSRPGLPTHINVFFLTSRPPPSLSRYAQGVVFGWFFFGHFLPRTVRRSFSLPFSFAPPLMRDRNVFAGLRIANPRVAALA